MEKDLRKKLGIDDWLELVKEDRNCNGAYISFGQYMYLLEKENQGLKNENAYYKYHIKLLEQQISLLKSQLKQTNEVLDISTRAKNKYIDIIDKARNKLTTMFDNGDDDKILDDLLELGEILGGGVNE